MSIQIKPGAYGYTAPLPTTPLPWWLLGTAIQIFERDDGEAPSDASHEFGKSNDGSLRDAEISEAVSPVWHTIPGEQALKGKRFCIWQRIGLTDEQRVELARLYRALNGTPYNYLRIAAHAGDRLVSWVKGLFGSKKPCRFFRRLAFLPEEICSTGIQRAFWLVLGDAKPFGVPWREAEPDDGHDFDLKHEGTISEQLIPPPSSGLRWTTWEECVDRGWV